MKTFIITSTIFFTFLLNPFSSINNDNTSKAIEKEKTHSIETIYDCNTGIFRVQITWFSSISNSQRTVIRNGYIQNYGLSPIIPNTTNNTEQWTFFLQNINPSVIPPGTTCRRDLIRDKVEMQPEVEEHEEVTSGQF